MANMSYCRFQNTLQELQECANYLEDDLPEDEAKARKKLIKLCYDIAADYADDNMELEEGEDEEYDN